MILSEEELAKVKPFAENIEDVSHLFTKTETGYASFQTTCNVCNELVYGFSEKQFQEMCIMHAVNLHPKEFKKK